MAGRYRLASFEASFPRSRWRHPPVTRCGLYGRARSPIERPDMPTRRPIHDSTRTTPYGPSFRSIPVRRTGTLVDQALPIAFIERSFYMIFLLLRNTVGVSTETVSPERRRLPYILRRRARIIVRASRYSVPCTFEWEGPRGPRCGHRDERRVPVGSPSETEFEVIRTRRRMESSSRCGVVCIRFRK